MALTLATVGGKITAALFNAVVGWVNANPPGLISVVPTSISNSGGTATLGSNGVITLAGINNATLNGIFTGQYQSYKIVYDLELSVADGLFLRLVTGGAADVNTVYDEVSSVGTSVGAAGAQTLAAINWAGAASISGISQRGEITVFDPFAVAPTTCFADLISLTNPMVAGASNAVASKSWLHRNATSFDGFFFSRRSTAILSGTIRVYGINNN